MANITLRSVKGSPLTNAEVDDNFSSLDNAKLELSGGTMTGPITFAGAQSFAASQLSGTVAVTNGGTGASTQSGARTNLGATTIGGNLFTLTNPGAITFPRFNADNTVSALSAADFRTAIGSAAGTVTSVSGTGSVNGITLSGTVTDSGSLTLGGTLSGVSLSTQVTGTLPVGNGGTGQTTVQASINALAGATTSGQYLRGNGTNVVMSAIQAGDVPTLNQNTTGTASNVTGTVAVANGGTGGTTQAAARTGLGATTVGANLFTLTNPGAITFPRFNADNTVSSLSAADFRTAIGAGTSSTTGTVTSVGGTGTVNGLTLTGTVTSSGNLTLGGTLSNVSLSSQVTGTLPLANGGSGQTTAQAAMNSFAGAVTNGSYLRGNGTNVVMSTIQAGDVPTLNQNTTGSAATLTTARTIRTNLASTSSASFNGSANITPGVTGTLPVANGGTGVTTSTGSGSVVLSTNSTLVGVKETRVALGSGSGTRTLNLNAGNYFTNTVTGTSTFAVSNTPSSGTSASFILDLTNGGSAEITWMTNTKWAGGTQPTLTSSGRDVLGFFTHDAGTTWNGFLLGKDVK